MSPPQVAPSPPTPLPFSEPSLTLVLWLLVRTNLSSSFDNKYWGRTVKHPDLFLVSTQSYSIILSRNPKTKNWPVDPEPRLQLPSNDFTFPFPPPLSNASFLHFASQPTVSSVSLLWPQLSFIPLFYPDSSISLIKPTLIQGIVFSSTMTQTCAQNTTKLRNMLQ